MLRPTPPSPTHNLQSCGLFSLALIVIDMQRGMQELSAGDRNNPGAEAVIAALLAAWRKAKAPVVHVRHMSRTPGSSFWPGQPGAEFQAALQPLDCEHVVEKNTPDAFTHTGLERWLHTRGIAEVVIVGVSTNNSVESTARTAGNLGFKTYVAFDATFAFAKTDFAGILRSADDVHAMALGNLHGEYATVVSSQELLSALSVGVDRLRSSV
jgi:nicotinamidase-related amidase